MKTKYYCMYAGLPGTFLELTARLESFDDNIFEILSKLFELVMRYKKKYFQPTASLAIVELFDNEMNSIYCKEEIKNN